MHRIRATFVAKRRSQGGESQAGQGEGRSPIAVAQSRRPDPAGTRHGAGRRTRFGARAGDDLLARDEEGGAEVGDHGARGCRGRTAGAGAFLGAREAIAGARPARTLGEVGGLERDEAEGPGAHGARDRKTGPGEAGREAGADGSAGLEAGGQVEAGKDLTEGLAEGGGEEWGAETR